MLTQHARLAASLLGMASLLASAAASAAVVYDEAVNGDLSNNPASATAVGTLALGTSTVTGRLPTIRPESGEEDPFDVFRFVVAAGTQVSAITLDFAQGSYPRGARINLGNTGGASIGNLSTANFSIFSGDNLFTNPSFGFSGPLGAGDYTFDLNGAGAAFGFNSYSFNFSVVDPNAQHDVPEPASGLLVAGSLLVLAATRRRRT